jgi:hypothetical protein
MHRILIALSLVAGVALAASSFTSTPETGVALTRAAPSAADAGVNVASANGDTVMVQVTFGAQSGVTLAGGPVDCWYYSPAAVAWSRYSAADLTIPNTGTRYWTSEPIPMPTTGRIYYAPRGVAVGSGDGGNTLSIWYSFTVGMAGSAGAPHFTPSTSTISGAVTVSGGSLTCDLRDAGVNILNLTPSYTSDVLKDAGLNVNNFPTQFTVDIRDAGPPTNVQGSVSVSNLPFSDAGTHVLVNPTIQQSGSWSEVLVVVNDGGTSGCSIMPAAPTKNRRGIFMQNRGTTSIFCVPSVDGGSCPTQAGQGIEICARGSSNCPNSLDFAGSDSTVIKCISVTATQVGDAGTTVWEY